MNWDVIAYGSGDFLRIVFTAVASIFGNADYIAAVQTAFFLGFLVFLIKGAINQDVMSGFKWFLAAMVLNLALLVPKTTVVITDRILPSPPAVVNNVPLGLAATAGFFSYTGDWFSRAFETVFAVPNAVRYTQNGLLFGHKVLEASRTMIIPDERTYLNFTEFFGSCVVVDGVGQGRFSWEEVLETNDLLGFFSTHVAQHAARFKYITSAGVQRILPCRSGFAGSLQPDLQALTDGIMNTGIRGFIANNSTASAALAKYKNDLPPAILYLTGMNITPQALALQSSLSNTMGNAVLKMARSVDDAAFATQYARLWAENERRTTYQTMGRIAEEKLPLLRAFIEAFLYAIFPIIALTALVMPTAVPFTYITTLLWINLWPPLYAILNFFISYYTQGVLTELASIYGSGFNAMANTQIMEYVTDMVATSGYLVSSLPIIAWILVSRSGTLAALAVSRIMQGYDTSVAHAAEQLTRGEGQLHGEHFRVAQENSLLVSNHPDTGNSGNVVAERQLPSGGTVTHTPEGRDFAHQLQSTGRVDFEMNHALTEQTSQAVDEAQTTLEQTTQGYTTSVQSTGQDLIKLDNYLSENHQHAANYSEGHASVNEQYTSELRSSVEKFVDSHSQTDSDQDSAALRGAIYGKVGLSGSVPGIDGGAQGSVDIGSEALRNRADVQSRADEYVNSDEYRDITRASAENAEKYFSQHDIGDGKIFVEGVSKSLDTQIKSAETFHNAESHLTAMQQQQQNAEAFGQIVKAAGLDTVTQHAINGGMTPAEVDRMYTGVADGNLAETEKFHHIIATLQAQGSHPLIGDHAAGIQSNFMPENTITPTEGINPKDDFEKQKAGFESGIFEGPVGVTREDVQHQIGSDRIHGQLESTNRAGEFEDAGSRINPNVDKPVSAPSNLMDSTHAARDTLVGSADTAFGVITEAAQGAVQHFVPALAGPPRMEQDASALNQGQQPFTPPLETGFWPSEAPATEIMGGGPAGETAPGSAGAGPAADVPTPPPEQPQSHPINRPDTGTHEPRDQVSGFGGGSPVADGLSTSGIEQETAALHAGGGAVWAGAAPAAGESFIPLDQETIKQLREEIPADQPFTEDAQSAQGIEQGSTPGGVGLSETGDTTAKTGILTDRGPAEPVASRQPDTAFSAAAGVAQTVVSPGIEQDPHSFRHDLDIQQDRPILKPDQEAATGQTQTYASIIQHEEFRAEPYKDGFTKDGR